MKKIGNFLIVALFLGFSAAFAYQIVPMVAGSFMHALDVRSKMAEKSEAANKRVREEIYLNVCPDYVANTSWFKKWRSVLNWCEDYLDRLPPK